MKSTPQLELAESYIQSTNISIFLTGKAGTGKTTFLNHLTKTLSKQFVILAPTGVAAINAGGVTIHSFFQLPFCPYLPDIPELITEYQQNGDKQKLRKRKIDIIKSLDLIIIDEISMVRADLLDAIDMRLRTYRHTSLPFGGVQLLLIGDIHQLPPVVTNDEAAYLQKVYPSPFFFSSKALQKINFKTIELTHIFRQHDASFIQLLNNIRDNNFDTFTLNELNKRHLPDFNPDKDANDYIRLTTHNNQADKYNQKKLNEIKKPVVKIQAEIEDKFPVSSYPTDEVLELKVGAQVMFIKNDPSYHHNYYNGLIGTISDIDNNSDEPTVYVTVDRDGKKDTIEVTPDTWENISYQVNSATNDIEQVVDGTFKQIPLRLAWAVTIHKAQGLTFDHVVIDIAAAFAYGQVYVALSRCRTLEGLVLSSRLTPHGAICDKAVSHFDQCKPTEAELHSTLATEQKAYFFKTLYQFFDYNSINSQTVKLCELMHHKLPKKYTNKVAAIDDIAKLVDTMSQVSNRFHIHIDCCLPSFPLNISKQRTHDTATYPLQDGRPILHNEDEYFAWLSERIDKASNYFLHALTNIAELLSPLTSLTISNKETSKDYHSLIDTLVYDILCKKYCIVTMQNKAQQLAAHFSPSIYLRSLRDFEKKQSNDDE